MTKQAEAAAADHLRAIALGYPDAVEEFPWGETAIKVRGRVFLFMRASHGKLGLSCKLPASHQAALLLPFTTPTGYGLGKSGWVSASFGPGEAPPLALLAAWIDESYRAVAPKKLAALLAAGGRDMSQGAAAERPKTTAPRTAAKKAPRTPPRTPPKKATRAEVRTAPKTVPRTPPRTPSKKAPEKAPRTAPEKAPRTASKKAPRTAPRNALETASKKASKTASKTAPGKAPRKAVKTPASLGGRR